MTLKILIVVGGVALFGAMILDRYTGKRSARVVLALLAALVVGVLLVSQLVASGFGPGGG